MALGGSLGGCAYYGVGRASDVGDEHGDGNDGNDDNDNDNTFSHS